MSGAAQWVQAVIAAGVLALAVLSFRTDRRSRANGRKLDAVHTLVNNQLTQAVDRRDVAESENVQLRADAKDGES